MLYVSINKKNEITGIFDRPLGGVKTFKTDKPVNELIGRRIGVMNPSNMKIAIICNWRTPCGISTYSHFLVDALKTKVKEIKIFSEIEDKADTTHDQNENVVRCWRRGESMLPTVDEIIEWNPDFVIIQHEFGIFPKATRFLKMLDALEDIPHAVVLHSVYGTHMDKTICTSAIKNIIVHSKEGKKALENLGHTSNFIQVVPHGCLIFDDVKELWNIFQTPYAIIQFGFGFFYKGVDRAIKAIGILKNSDPKFKDIFYCYLCSESTNSSSVHGEYRDYLEDLIKQLGLEDNVAIIRKYHSDESINNYLRTAKLALFPYITDPENVVYGASGAVRVAMSNNIPVIASESHMFDDLEGIVPRPKNEQELAQEIDKIFSNEEYKTSLLFKTKSFVQDNNWGLIANKYLNAITRILENNNFIEINTK
ncbi:MAG: glycosyltransferase [Crenarchaeota archaeon]|nr:MAG: glycosyltransferase [Thermoproteota archaeon]